MGSGERHENATNGFGSGHGSEVSTWSPPPEDILFEEHGRVELSQILGTLRESWRLIAVITVIALAATMAVTMATRMEFSVHGSIYLGDLKSQSGMLDAVSSQFDFGLAKGEISTEIEILRSRKLITQAVLASGYNTRLRPAGWNPPHYLAWRLGKRDVRQLEGAWKELRAVSTQLTGAAGVGQHRTVSVTFTSDSEYKVFDGGNVVGAGVLAKPLHVPGIDLMLVAGPEHGPHSGNQYEIDVYSLDDTIDGIEKEMTIKSPKSSLPGNEADIGHLELTTKYPFQAQAFLEQLIHEYLDQNLAWKTEEAAAAETFLTKQLDNVRKTLDKSLSELADFKKKSTTIDLTEEAKSMIGNVSALEQQRLTARLEVDALQQVKSMLAKGNVPPEAYLVGEAQDSVFMAMSQALVKAQQDYKVLTEQFTPDYPPVREARAALDAQLKAIQGYVDSRLKRAQEQLAALESAMDRYTSQLRELPDAELKLATLTQETEVYSKVYEFLLERQQQAALTKASTVSKSRVLDTPTVPSLEGAPKLKVRLPLGLALGLFLGIAFVLARWRLATTFQSESEIRKMMPSVGLFASVPRQRGGAEDNAQLKPLEALQDLRSPFAEAFRLLRTNLYYSGSRDADKIIVISSPGPRDGKTLTTLSLAGILAADGKRVLVIDADMRKPSHHALLRQPQQPGLTGILTNEFAWGDTVHVVKTPFGEFSSISTGTPPPNPAELLSSPYLASFLAEARSNYDFVLIDSPPFPLVSDGLVLSHCADRVLSVLRVGVSHRRVAWDHVRRLASVTPHYGLIINDVSAGGRYGYGYGYGYPYGYGASAKSKSTSRKSGFREPPTT